MNSFEKGRALENEIEEKYGKRQPMSGAHFTAKEDVAGRGDYDILLFQTKNADGQKSYSIKVYDLKKLRKNATMAGKTGVFVIRFGENQKYFLINEKDFDFLYGLKED